MAAQSLLAKLGMRLGVLGSAASLAFAYPLAANDPSMAAHTDANRIGTYADRTPGAEKVGHIIKGTEVLSVGVASIAAAVPVSTPASTLTAAGLNIGQGTAPSAPVNGDVWLTASGLFYRAGGTTSTAGSVTTVSVVTANGVSGTVATATTTPAITLTLGAITPSSVASTGLITGTNLRSGTGSPEGVVTAAVGSLFERTDGGAGTTLYVKESGAGNTGWVAQGGGAGTVTSVGVTSTDLSVSGSPVTGSGNITLNVNAGAITLAKMANLAANSIIGNNTGGATTPLALTTTQVTAMLDVFTSGLKGLAPASGGGTTNFLRADGTWAAPGGGITGTLTSGRVPFANGTSSLTDSSQMVFSTASGLSINRPNTTGTEFFGLNAGNSTATGARNTGIGASAIAALTAGTDNTALGYNANASTAGGTDNTAVGASALAAANGIGNTAVGSQALKVLSVGSTNTALGSGALAAQTSASGNTAVGASALANFLNTGGNNTAVGSGTGTTLTTGTGNILLGAGADVATSSTSNTLMIGGTTAISAGFIGNGATNATPQSITLNATGGSGLNVAGASFTIAGGRGTGTGVGGAINFQVAKASGSSSTANTLVTAHSILQDGGVDWTGITTVNQPAVSAANHGVIFYDSTLQVFRASLNGGAYVTITSGGISGSLVSGRVPFANGASSLTDSSTFTFSTASGLSVNRTGATRCEYFGSGAGNATATGVDCTAVGANAGLALTSGTDNTLVGSRAGTAVLGGASNTAVGSTALFANTTGSDNTAIGVGANGGATGLQQTTFVGSSAGNRWGSDRTVGIGYQAIRGGSPTPSSNSGTNNTAIGYQALRDLTSGDQNVAIGDSAMFSANSGDANRNVAIGYQSLFAIDGNTSLSNDNVAVGYQTMLGSTTSAQVTAIGSGALKTGTTGIGGCTAVGYNALLVCTVADVTAVGAAAADALTTSLRVTAVGKNAVGTGTTGVTDCTGIGHNALALATGSQNTAVGSLSGDAISTGSSNTCVGYDALGSMSTATQSCALGVSAGASSNGGNNVFIGYQAGTTYGGTFSANVIIGTQAGGGTGASGQQNTLIGHQAGNVAANNELTAVGHIALLLSSSGGGHVAVGAAALASITTNSNCTGVGYHALTACTGASNTAVGSGASDALTTSTRSTALGYNALGAATTGADDCVAIGTSALLTNNAVENVAVGSSAMSNNSTGTASVAVGFQALIQTTASGNTAIGHNAGSSNITGSGNIFIGVGAGTNSASSISNTCFIGGTQSVSDIYIGSGEISASVTNISIHATGGSGTDITGGFMYLCGGRPTGAGVGGSVTIQTAPAGAGGTTLRTLVDRLTIDHKGNIVPGTAALATSATDGFLYLPTCAGTPSGVPTGFTGRAAFVYDSTANKLWVYNGSWRGVVVT